LEAQADRAPSSDPEEAEFRDKQVAFMLDRVRIYSQGSYLDGLRLLGELGPVVCQDAASSLAGLSNLQPRYPLGREEYASLRKPVVEDMNRLNDRHHRLVATQQRLRDSAVDRLAKLNQSLQINPNDSWQDVIAKAKSLRDLGRTADAMAAFVQYGERFASSDAGALAYSKTAQEFTRQLSTLGVSGGVYVFAVPEAGAAVSVGLRVGDILLTYAGAPIPSVPEFAEALRKSAPGDMVRLEYLRLTADGIFTRQVVTVPGGPLGVGVMPT
jgi:hypothetical protein